MWDLGQKGGNLNKVRAELFPFVPSLHFNFWGRESLKKDEKPNKFSRIREEKET